MIYAMPFVEPGIYGSLDEYGSVQAIISLDDSDIVKEKIPRLNQKDKKINLTKQIIKEEICLMF